MTRKTIYLPRYTRGGGIITITFGGGVSYPLCSRDKISPLTKWFFFLYDPSTRKICSVWSLAHCENFAGFDFRLWSKTTPITDGEKIDTLGSVTTGDFSIASSTSTTIPTLSILAPCIKPKRNAAYSATNIPVGRGYIKISQGRDCKTTINSYKPHFRLYGGENIIQSNNITNKMN